MVSCPLPSLVVNVTHQIDPLALTFMEELPEEADVTIFSVNDEYVMAKAKDVAAQCKKVTHTHTHNLINVSFT